MNVVVRGFWGNEMSKARGLFTLAVGVFLPISAFTHHASVEYDDSTLIELRGEVVSVFWRNPHVHIVVRDQNSEEWEIEGSSVNRLERLGLESEMFGIGEPVSILGFSSQRVERRLLPVYATLAGGREIVMMLAPAKAFGLVDENAQSNVTLDDSKVELATDRASGIFRVWTFSGRSGGNEDLPLTADARTQREAWVQPEDWIWRCDPPGLIENMLNPYPIEFIDRGNEITLHLEQWDGVRTIFMDRVADEENRPGTRMGYSVGRWEGATLVVETRNIDNELFDDLGTPQSSAAQITERFTLSADETRLDWEATVTDPGTFTEPVTPELMHWVWVPGEEVKPFECATQR